MPTLRRTIRLFVSSTFSDMKSERDVLQADVFPKLRQLCLSNGLRFQPIDLRWGVPEEAGQDNRTMRICQRELKRCQEGRPKPNFLILLGGRYGWQPLPETIPVNLFVQLSQHLPAAMRELLEWRDEQAEDAKGWYRVDDNAVPPVYELRPRGEDQSWHERVEKPLLEALEAAARDLDVDAWGVYVGASATEQEIRAGALTVGDAHEHVHAFFRTIRGLPQEPVPGEFVDVAADGTRDPAAGAWLDDLKKRIEKKIGKDNIHDYTVPWRYGVRQTDLARFGKDVFEALKKVIDAQIKDLKSASLEVQEEERHRAFGEERCRGFLGRGEPLEEIAGYLRTGGEMLAVVGPSGSGKSAVMAEAVRQAREAYGESAVLARFIGATPDSANIISLLRNLVTEIRGRTPRPAPAAEEASPKVSEIPFEINPLVAAFHEALGRATAGRPLILFLDALDQLAAGNDAWEGYWLPGSIPSHVCVVLSAALPAEAGVEKQAPDPAQFGNDEPRAAVMAMLDRHRETIRQIRLEPLTVNDGEALTKTWLGWAGRTLQPRQTEEILTGFAGEGSPLWLKVAVGESLHLRSWEQAPHFDRSLPGLLRQVLDHLSGKREHGRLLVAHGLVGIASARHGLAEDEVMDVLSADKELMQEFYGRSPTERRKPKAKRIKALPVAVWVRFHGDIADYLTEHAQQDVALMGFYHRSFLEAVQAAYLGMREKRQAAHQRLAEYFWEKPVWFDPQRKAPNARRAGELVFQQRGAGQWTSAETTLLDCQFLMAKCAAGLAMDLDADYQAVLWEAPAESLPRRQLLGWVRGGFGLSLHVLVPDPEQLASQMVGRLLPLRDDAGVAKFVDEMTAAAPRPWLRPLEPALHPPGTPLVRTLAGHTDSVTAVSLTADGRFAVSASWDKTLKVWELATGREVHTLRGHTESVLAVSLTRDGRFAVSASQDHTLKVWELASGCEVHTLKGHTSSVPAVALTEDGRFAVSASSDTLKVWKLASGREVRTLTGHTGPVAAVSLTRDGRFAVSASLDNTLKVWELASGREVHTLKGHTDKVKAVSLTPDGRFAVSASADTTLKVWELASGRELRTLAGHTSELTVVSVTADGRFAVSAPWDTDSWDNTLKVWELASGREVHTLKGHTGPVSAVSLTADGRIAVSASGSWDRTLKVWDLASGREVHMREGHTDYVVAVCLTADGRFAVSASRDHTLKMWNLESRREVRTLKGHTSSVWAVALTRDGRFAVSASGDHTLKVWELASGREVHRLKGHTYDVTAVCLTGDGRFAVSASWDKTLKVWELASGRDVHTLKGHTEPVYAVTLTADGRFAVSASADETLKVWELESGREVRTLKGHAEPVWAVALTADGRFAVSASRDKTLKVWDLESGREVHTLAGHTGEVAAVSLTADGRFAVSASWDRTLRVWDLESGREVRTLKGHTGEVAAISLTRDGRFTVSASSDHTLRVWELASGNLLATFTCDSAVYCCAFCNEDRVIAGDSGGRVHFLQFEHSEPGR